MAGAGYDQVFTFAFHDNTDVGNFTVLDGLFHPVYLDGRQACYFAYTRPHYRPGRPRRTEDGYTW
jgi:hypothetical protein